MRRWFMLWPAAGLVFVVFTLYVRREQLAPSLLRPNAKPKAAPSAPAAAVPSAAIPATSDGVLSQETRAAYIYAIMSPEATDLPRLQCPKLETARYQDLQLSSDTMSPEIRYFFAIDLRQCLTLLPRLLGSVVEAIRFLGPQNCALSIIEGNSDDGTTEVLAALRPELEALGTNYYFSSSDINPKKGDRIEALARLRNLALQPIFDDAVDTFSSSSNRKRNLFSVSTIIIFLNDVAACPEDILELTYQHAHLGADLVCGMDWTYVGRDPTFYDVWIARGLAGDSFFEIPPDGNWNSAWNLFWNDDVAEDRFRAHKPFQVFSCWNGAAVFTAAPLLEKGVRFRRPREGECHQGEPQLFCKDLWWHGYGKIAVVPVVNLEYSNEAGVKIKEAKGYTSQWVETAGWQDDGVEWQKEPPEKVKCMGVYSKQFFEAWNKTQPGT
ncbi:glycosyltransferase [Dichotomopilus funicola]|uniref:Glycosyltransferase n=1 Tax=Dichotomopilus funicola TaxID=1934379 RepID=A0AAN6UWA2_9PEZI|nr:glycosyltransferase [Dichotomopilus funicola]